MVSLPLNGILINCFEFFMFLYILYSLMMYLFYINFFSGQLYVCIVAVIGQPELCVVNTFKIKGHANMVCMTNTMYTRFRQSWKIPIFILFMMISFAIKSLMISHTREQSLILCIGLNCYQTFMKTWTIKKKHPKKATYNALHLLELRYNLWSSCALTILVRKLVAKLGTYK